MRRVTLLAALTLVACQTTAPPPIAPAATMTEDQRLEAMARDLLTHFTAGRFIDATKNFDTTMMSSLGPTKLAEFARQMTGQAGAFKSVGAAQMTTVEGYRVVVLPAEYERTRVNVRVVFDGNGKVAGLFFVPAG